MNITLLDEVKDREWLEQARARVDQYRLTLQSNGQGGFIGSSVEMPRVFAEGETMEACAVATRHALVGAVAYMLKLGRTPPAPVRERRRDEQINLRVSADEKVLLEASARDQGFRSVSDFVRTKALQSTGSVATR